MKNLKNPLSLLISLTTLCQISRTQIPNLKIPQVKIPNINIPQGPQANTPNFNISNPFENMDILAWDKIDQLCQSILTAKDIEHLDPSYLRIIEYTALGYRSHSTYPSAAITLMESSHFEKDSPTVIFVHGFTDGPLLDAGRSIADAYKNRGRYNVLALDASVLIKSLYLRSVVLAKYIGEYLSFFLYDLVRLGMNPTNLHVIGHSLGAQISGFAGKSYQALMSGEKIPRITGLDPANPCFLHTGSENRLDASDAHFVDIIHTNGGVKGLNISIGHVDFYPNNGGARQPGCKDDSCSHARAWEFFKESVNSPQNFISVKCDNWESFLKHECTENERAVMGYLTPTSTRGNFYLKTGSSPDYGLGNEGVL